VDRIVANKFDVRGSFALPEGESEYQVAYDDGSKQKFVELEAELSGMGLRPEMTGTKDDCVLTVRKSGATVAPASRIPVLMALFTLASLVVFSLLQRLVYAQLIPSFPGYFVFFGFGVTVAVLMGAHELGQRYAASKRKSGHANSYLLPWVPFLPPFIASLGFIANQREPALNRDNLFDTVIAGPVAVLGLALILYFAGQLTGVQSTIAFKASQVAVSINSNAIQVAIDAILSPILPKVAAGHLWLSPVSDAATVGFILAFIGLLPMASFDGGFLSNLAWGPRVARAATYLSVLTLLALDMGTATYWAIAIVALLLAGRPFRLKLLDEVSGLSPSRRWIYLVALAAAFLALPIPHDLATLPLG
jgi:membrane-associated protease RseP (regulator of RpoE activity)